MIQERITRLSNAELIENMKALISSERKTLVSFLMHLSEVSERGLHIAEGYSNLVDYCTKEFRISEGSAYKRMQVARASRKYPVILDYIRDQKISLSVASLLCPHLKPDNHESRIDQAIGLSKRDVEKLIAGWAPKPELKESIRKAPVISAVKNTPPNYPGAAKTDPRFDIFSTQAPVNSFSVKAESKEIITDKRICLRFTIGEETEEKIKRVKEVLSARKDFSGTLEEIMDLALDALLEKSDPEKRQNRREKKTSKSSAPVTKKHKTPAQAKTRYIPQKTKDLLLKQAGYQCSYVSPDGKRCGCKTGLQIDHKRPFSKDRRNDINNLQVLCRTHNLYKATLQIGKKTMDRYLKKDRSD